MSCNASGHESTVTSAPAVAQSADLLNQNATAEGARIVAAKNGPLTGSDLSGVTDAESHQSTDCTANSSHTASSASVAPATVHSRDNSSEEADQAKEVEFMNEQNLARSRSPKPTQSESGGWDFRGQLLGAGSKVLSPISSSSRFVKSLFWSANANDTENVQSSETIDPSSSSSSSSTVADVDSSSSSGPCFGVNIPLESRTAEARPGVYHSKDEILKMIKKCQGARFKAFSNVSEAESFAQMTEDDLLNSSLLIKTPSKPKNPVFIDSPPPPPKLQQQPQSPLQLQHQQQYQQQIIQQQLNSIATQGERLAFKAPKTQDLMSLRRHITAGNKEAIENLVWSNPRYLISSGDTPTIVQEGFHYTAMHVAARHGKHEIVEMLIDTLSEIRLMKILYGEEADEVVKSRQIFLLDLYLNLPDKGANDTPLHLACKFGHIDVIRILLRHPLTSRNEINKFKETPAEVVCSRCPRGEDEADIYRLEILKMFEKIFVVPILRPENGLGAPKVGVPVHFSSMYSSSKPSLNSVTTSSSSASPRPPSHSSDSLHGTNIFNPCENNSNSSSSNNFVISAYAGPMMEKEAMTYRLRLCRPFRNSIRQIIACRYSPKRTVEEKTINSDAFEYAPIVAATTSTITIKSDEVKPEINFGSSGDETRESTHSTSDAEGKNESGRENMRTLISTDGSGEMLPSVKGTMSASVDSSSIASTSVDIDNKDSFIQPSSTASSSERMQSSFATPVKVTPPWSFGSATLSVGSGDIVQSTPVSSAPRLIDSEKGLEHEGRLLAGDMNVEWKERWDFLGCDDLLDFGAANGLKKLEEYFQGKYEEVEERESNIQELPLEDSFNDEDANDSLGDLAQTFKTKLVIMSPTKEDSPLDDIGKMDSDDVVADLSQRFEECGTESASSTNLTQSPSSLRELCRLANPFDTVGVTQPLNKNKANDLNLERRRETEIQERQSLVAPIKSTSLIPFEAQVYVKGSLPSHMDVELLHALRNSPVDPAIYPYLFKWLHLVKSNSEDERLRWPTTPGAVAATRSVAAFQTTPRGVVASEARMRRMMGEAGDSDLSSRGLRPTTLSFDFSPAEVKRKSRIDKVDMRHSPRNSPNRRYDDNGNIGK